MTEQYLHGNRFWDWRGWDVLKWITAGVVLFCVFVLIFAGVSGQADQIWGALVAGGRR
jgi:hypothetical protein